MHHACIIYMYTHACRDGCMSYWRIDGEVQCLDRDLVWTSHLPLDSSVPTCQHKQHQCKPVHLPPSAHFLSMLNQRFFSSGVLNAATQLVKGHPIIKYVLGRSIDSRDLSMQLVTHSSERRSWPLRLNCFSWDLQLQTSEWQNAWGCPQHYIAKDTICYSHLRCLANIQLPITAIYYHESFFFVQEYTVICMCAIWRTMQNGCNVYHSHTAHTEVYLYTMHLE